MAYTHTYAILKIDQTSFDDIECRLRAAGCFDEYHGVSRDGTPLIVFGAVALSPEGAE